MSGSGSSNEESDREASWTSERLPLSVRKELLRRELRKLGFGGAESAVPVRSGTMQQQQQPQPAPPPDSDHPQAAPRDNSPAA